MVQSWLDGTVKMMTTKKPLKWQYDSQNFFPHDGLEQIHGKCDTIQPSWSSPYYSLSQISKAEYC